MNTVAASIPVLRWAAQRGFPDNAHLLKNFPKLNLWLTGDEQPTLKQLEKFAKLTRTAFGYFFLPEPPKLTLPIADFRIPRNETLPQPSSNLLDILYLCQQRQDWYRDYARAHSLRLLPFVGSANIQESPKVVAERMRTELKILAKERRKVSTWEEALRQLINKAEDAGVMLMVSSIVGSNTRRKLDPTECRGFALADPLAPLVFLNGSDSKAAQMFTFAYELAHLWLGTSGTGVSNIAVNQVPEQRLERWCNEVAAEFLMPLELLQKVYQSANEVPSEMQRLAKIFKVSTLVVLRRLCDGGFIDQADFSKYYDHEIQHLKLLQPGKSKGSGGNFYHTLGMRTSRRFVKAVIASTLEEETLFRDALRMLAMRKTATFYEAANKFRVMG